MNRFRFMMNSSKQFYRDSNKSKVIAEKQTFNFSFKKVVALCGLSYVGLGYYYLHEQDKQFAYKFSWSRLMSRFVGYAAYTPVPEFLRETIYRKFGSTYGVVEEDIVQPIKSFPNFREFFTRAVKPREFDTNPYVVVSPADSKLLQLKEVTGDSNLLIKDIHYSLGEFLTGVENYKINDEVFESLKQSKDKKKSKIYQAVFYLCPGDYHRYHSPADVTVKRSAYIPGYLAPVKESYIAKPNRCYETNERVAAFCDWAGGFMSITFVGALNVGSIGLDFDPKLDTNCDIPLQFQKTNEQTSKLREYALKVTKGNTKSQDSVEFDKNDLFSAANLAVDKKNIEEPIPSVYTRTEKGIKVPKAAQMGMFNFGSTIVMHFEVPNGAEFPVKAGDAVRYGQTICVAKK